MKTYFIKIFFTFLTFLNFTNVYSQLNYTDFNWVQTFGGPKNDITNNTIVDAFGNMIVTGTFQETAEFGGISVQSLGSWDSFIAKYDSNGELIWVKTLGGEYDEDGIKSVVSDASGNIYISGTYEYSLDLDPNEDEFIVSSNGMRDNYLIKLDINGNFVWGKSYGNSFSDSVSFMTIDANNNLYMTGAFRETLDFGMGGIPHNLTASAGSDAYVLKMNPLGELIWAKSFDGTNFESGSSLAVDHDFNLYIIGTVANATIDLDPGEGVFIVSSNAGSNDGNAFLVKLNPNGEFVNGGITAKDNQNPARITVVDMKVDSQNNLYLSGHWYGSIDFDFGTGSQVFPSLYASHSNTFVMKLNPDLEFQWFNRAVNYVAVRASSLSIDKNDVIYLTGYSDGGAIFGGNKLETCWCLVESTDAAYIATINTDGYWTNAFDYSYNSKAFGALDAANNLYLGGNFKFSLRFSKDLNETLFYLENPDEDYEHGFIMKLGNQDLEPLSNHPPTANDDQAEVLQGTDTQFSLSDNDTDLENNIDLGSIHIVRQPQFGTLTLHQDGSVTYQHDGGESTEDNFSYTISDLDGLVSNLGFVNITIQPFMSTNENEISKEFKIYPNPSSSVVNFNFDFKTVQIFDLSGKLVLTTDSKQINISHLQKGVYLVYASRINGKSIRLRFVKN